MISPGAKAKLLPNEPKLFAYIRESEIGRDVSIETPFGTRDVVYADYTASGRALTFIEDYVREEVLPTYGNTHTAASRTGAQTSDFVSEARTMIKTHVRGNKDDRCLFVGSGATAAANQLVALLGLVAPTPAARAAARALPEVKSINYIIDESYVIY